MTSYLAMENRLEDATLTASSEATGYPVSRIATGVLGDSWKPSAAGNQIITAAFSAPVTVDYIALFGHQFDRNGVRAQLEYSADGGVTWTALSSVHTPTTQRLIYEKRTSTSSANWRLRLYPKQNLLTYSEQFDNAAWPKTNCTVTANAAVAPNGSATSDLIEATADGNDYIAQIYSTTGHAGKTYTFSAWLKNVDRSGVLVMRIRDGGGTEVGSKTVTMTSDWQRFEVTGTFGSSPASNISVFIDPHDTTLNAGLGYYAWGAQLEEAPAAGEYQATTGAAAVGEVGPLAFAAIGQALALPKGPRVGFEPPLTVGIEIEDSVSRDGWLLGLDRYVLPEDLTIEQERVDPDWVDSNWPAIHRRVTKRPFIFAWDPDNHPDQVYYCWPSRRLTQPRWSTPTRKSFSIRTKALISTGMDE